MTYQEKIKQSKKVLAAIKALGHDEVMQFTFGTEYCYKAKKEIDRVFEIKAFHYKTTGNVDYSIYEAKSWGRGMNVDRVTSTSLRLYSYDMMGNKTTYTMPLYAMYIRTAINDAPIEDTDKATVLEGI